ncbi:histidine phosphatase family protein [uncultured Amnibacterium sp.]|uniref:histidine phosphatase family protein n=1 Tax=uncultured Amnibacterium sp. TaxID=1631851 RepID=UPI0035CC3D88
MSCFYITHPEVIVDPAVPIDEWGLSRAGKERAAQLSGRIAGEIRVVVSSGERKAIETVAILAEALGVSVSIDQALGEMNRSATGYLPPDEFERTADAFFAHPEISVRGWERAIDAQRRVETAVRGHLRDGLEDGIAFVAHGGVGGLLLASLDSVPISRTLDQPGLGSYFMFDARNWKPLSFWKRIQ